MYNNPYLYNNFYPYQGNIMKRGLLNSLKIHKFNWSNFLNNTQKTLNLINQAIPAYYQVKPIFNNAKTMFRMVNALKDNDKDSQNNDTYTNNKTSKKEPSNYNNDGPIFFV